ncbi:MAG: apolipoprotein N-acyltransferase [Bdellovibrionales bacterium]
MIQWFFPILSGLFLGTSYIPFYPWALFVVWVPLWICWFKNPTYKNIFLTGVLSTVTFNMIGFHWIASTAREFGHLSWDVSILILILFSLISALHVPLSGVAWLYLRKKYSMGLNESIWVLAVLYWVFETLSPTIFPWNLGYPWLWAQWPGIQWADVVGFQGLSFVTVVLNALVAWFFLSPLPYAKKLKPLLGGFAFFLSLQLTGYLKSRGLPQADKTLKVLAVQANIGNLEKAYAEKGMGYQDYIIDQHFDLTRKALKEMPKPDLIVYPETALPIPLDADYKDALYNKKLNFFLKETGIPIMVGAYSEPPPDRGTRNSVFLLDPQGEILGSYDKTLLLAFGEYLPGGDRFPILYKWLPFVSHFYAGHGPSIIKLGDLHFGIQVCYEGLYPWFTTELVNLKTQIIFNATNDSWFGKNFEPQQHLYMTAARAIEYRRPLIRTTNTGITTAVLPSGQFLQQSPIYEEWFGVFEVPYSTTPQITLYSRLEPFLVYLVLFMSIGVFGVLKRKSL